MKNAVKNAMLAAAVLASAGLLTSGAQADFVAGPTVDVSGAGFGNIPRLLTLHDNDGTETGGVVVNADCSSTTFGNFVPPPADGPHNNVVTLGELNWTSGSDVSVGVEVAEGGGPNAGITLSEFTLSVYNNANTEIGTFSLAAPIVYTAAQTSAQNGTGVGIFTLVLDAAQQLIWDGIAALAGSSTFQISASLGTFTDAQGGNDSFLALAAAGPPTVIPLPGALVLFGSGLVGLTMLARRRRSRMNAPAVA